VLADTKRDRTTELSKIKRECFVRSFFLRQAKPDGSPQEQKIFANQPQSRFRDASTQYAIANSMVRLRHWQGLSIYQTPAIRQHPPLANRKVA
jgi:hypothetical protein